ncbi:hypothetical protein [Ancylobacter mangrovi]|uniref:hypothetical protein n=1 Tax=Ancylobacter mangrovi TaxID=2972472 RepID=UPI002163AFC2|nr:hypothetical protein [Ancylobacter mangrovi]MCS0501572.1 hypothetical protein [Ancylobacter mangrovi]
MTRHLEIRLTDAHIGIWQSDPNDPTFKTEIFDGLIRLLRARGWTVGRDPRVHTHYRSISKNHRIARKGEIRAEFHICGHAITFEFWATTWKSDHVNGHRYDSNRIDRFDYLDRLRMRQLETVISSWCEQRAQISVSRSRPHPSSGKITARAFVESSYAESWHSDKALGRPLCKSDENRRSRDGCLLEQGMTVWTKDYKGRIVRGTALYHINNMWWVVAGPYALLNVCSRDIYVECPEDVRRKRNGRERRVRLEAELAKAIRRDDFRRADVLRRILFGSEPTYRIWSRKNDAYYRADYCGYTTDVVSAGRYTRAEAEREVRRVPHHLHAIGPDGRREDFGTSSELVA